MRKNRNSMRWLIKVGVGNVNAEIEIGFIPSQSNPRRELSRPLPNIFAHHELRNPVQLVRRTGFPLRKITICHRADG